MIKINLRKFLFFIYILAENPVEEIEDDASSMWHTGPVHSSKLGLWDGTSQKAEANVDMNSGFDNLVMKKASENNNNIVAGSSSSIVPSANNSDDKNEAKKN